MWVNTVEYCCFYSYLNRRDLHASSLPANLKFDHLIKSQGSQSLSRQQYGHRITVILVGASGHVPADQLPPPRWSCCQLLLIRSASNGQSLSTDIFLSVDQGGKLSQNPVGISYNANMQSTHFHIRRTPCIPLRCKMARDRAKYQQRD